MTEEKKSYYAIIPADVRYDESLPPNAKLLYGEITALCNAEGYCWASNKYFAELYGVSAISISKWINALVDRGYISSQIIYKEGTKQIDGRYIKILYDPIKEKFNTSITKVKDPIKEKFNTPIKEKFKDNNTVINNTFNTTNEYIDKSDKPTRKRFVPPSLEEVQAYCLERKNKVNAEKFINHYTSNGWYIGRTKMKDWKAAVRTWEGNGYDNKKPEQPKVQQGSGNSFVNMMIEEGFINEQS